MKNYIWGGVFAVCGTFVTAAIYLIFQPEIRSLFVESYKPSGLPVAVIGDSDSHIYRDHINGIRRGGIHHNSSFQWTEIWDRLRGEEVDQGELGVWGTRGKIARIRGLLGLESRIFKKRDFRFNYSVSGARCNSLYSGYPYQVPSLLSLMKRKPGWFQFGLVFVRIGINDFGQKSHLVKWAKADSEDIAIGIVNRCLLDIRQVVEDVLSLPTNSMVVLVDISHDYNGSSFDSVNLSTAEINRMRSVLYLFESGLKKITSGSNRVAYVDAVTHTRNHWGDRYLGTLQQETTLGGSTPVKSSVGDEPYYRTLLDGHAGTINNGLWLQSAIRQINEQLGIGLTPLLDAEIADLVDPNGMLGIAPVRGKHTSEAIQLSGLSDQIEIRERDLPFILPELTATSTEGLDVTDSIIAFLEKTPGELIWLHGSGRRLSLQPDRVGLGDYLLTMRAHDRYGNQRKWNANITISK